MNRRLLHRCLKVITRFDLSRQLADADSSSRQTNVLRSLRVPPVFRLARLPFALLVLSIPFLAQGQMGGGMGGMGGGMGGAGALGGGMGGGEMDARNRLLAELSKNPVTWKRPTGEVPFWLRSASSASESMESLRAKLNDQFEVEFNSLGLQDAIRSLEDICAIQFEVNSKALNDSGLTMDDPVTIRSGWPLREILRRMLEPSDLTFIVHETSIEITTQDNADIRPVLRYYDLGFVQSDSTNLVAIVGTIEQSIEPDTWASQGGSGAIHIIGQLLVVSGTEKAHIGIERLLFRLGFPEAVAKPVNAAAQKKREGSGAKQEGSAVLPPSDSKDPFGADPVPPAKQPTKGEPKPSDPNDPFGK